MASEDYLKFLKNLFENSHFLKKKRGAASGEDIIVFFPEH